MLTFLPACSWHSPTAAEEPELPAGAKWITDHYQAILLEQQQALLAAQQAGAAGGEEAALSQAQSGPVQPEGAAVPAKHDKSPTQVRWEAPSPAAPACVNLWQLHAPLLAPFLRLSPTPCPLPFRFCIQGGCVPG